MTAARILVVDDDPDIRRLLGEELREGGHEALFAADGPQALMIARREIPDLILLDLRLPGGDGIAVLERLKTIPQTTAIPVIVLSSVRADELVEQALLLGAYAYIRKSLTTGALGASIDNALRIVSRRPLDVVSPLPPVSPAAALDSSHLRIVGIGAPDPRSPERGYRQWAPSVEPPRPSSARRAGPSFGGTYPFPPTSTAPSP